MYIKSLFVVFFLSVFLFISAEKEEFKWENTGLTTALWESIKQHDSARVRTMLSQYKQLPFIRAEDGRGALFWSYEFKFAEGVSVFLSMGASPDETDAAGLKPEDLFPGTKEEMEDFMLQVASTIPIQDFSAEDEDNSEFSERYTHPNDESDDDDDFDDL